MPVRSFEVAASIPCEVSPVSVDGFLCMPSLLPRLPQPPTAVSECSGGGLPGRYIRSTVWRLCISGLVRVQFLMACTFGSQGQCLALSGPLLRFRSPLTKAPPYVIQQPRSRRIFHPQVIDCFHLDTHSVHTLAIRNFGATPQKIRHHSQIHSTWFYSGLNVEANLTQNFFCIVFREHRYIFLESFA